MHFSVERDKLFAEIQTGKKYLTKLVPALSNFLVEVDDNMQQITITSSDTKNHFIAKLPAQVKKGGTYILDAAILLGGVKQMESGKWLHFKEDTGVVVMTCDKTKLKIPTSNAGAFIPIPLFGEDAILEMTTDDLNTIIRSTTFARLPTGRATQQSDFKWEGISMRITNGMALFACSDRNRVTFARHQFNSNIDAEFILDARSVEDFVNALDDGLKITFKVNTQMGRISLECANRLLLPALYGDKYVDITKFVPIPTSSITVKRDEFITKLEIAALVNDIVELKAKGKTLSFESRAPGAGEYLDSMTASITNGMDVTLRVPYLLEGLKRMDATDVELRLVASDKPAIIAPKGKSEYAYLLMPIA